MKPIYYIDGRYLNSYEIEFIEKLEGDLKCFDSTCDRLLLFPPLFSRYRFLSHKFIDEFYFPKLCSFSVGAGDIRRTVVISTSSAIKCCLPFSCIHEKINYLNKDSEKLCSCICIERIYFSSSQEKGLNHMYCESMKVAQNNELMKPQGGSDTSEKNRRKRPDKQLYVPRALRQKVLCEKTVPHVANSKNISESAINCADLIDKIKHGTEDSFVVENMTKKRIMSRDKDDILIEPSKANILTSINKGSFSNVLNVKADICAQNESKNSCMEVQSLQNEKLSEFNSDMIKKRIMSMDKGDILIEPNKANKLTSIDKGSFSDLLNVKADICTQNVSKNSCMEVQSLQNKNSKNSCMEVQSLQNEKLSEFNSDSTSVGKLSKCTSLSDQNTKVSDLFSEDSLHKFIVPESETLVGGVENMLLNHTDSLDKNIISPTLPIIPSKDSSIEHILKGDSETTKDDSWETKFNDDGECLVPEIIKELTNITGKMEIQVPKNDYSNYGPGDISQENDNIVELYDFPVEFNTQDLVSALSLFQKSSFSIKWVDDCHALAVFISPTGANQALTINHPFVKIRPISEGIKESKEKARCISRTSEPYKPRPTTSASLARRLVSGALGLKIHTSEEQRNIERSKLKEAKERRKQKEKQQQDIWDGVV